MKHVIKVDSHCHTHHSPDSLAKPQAILAACRRKKIDRLIITDHNTITGALECQALDPERFIVGEEIMTKEGELLAAFVVEEIPPGLYAVDAIERLRAQGAFISVSHPFDTLRSGSWSLPDLEAITPLVDAVEVFNARCFPVSNNYQAELFAQKNGLLGTAGSDAHAAFEIGRGLMEMELFDSKETFLANLKDARVVGKPTPLWVRLVSRYAVISKRIAGS